MKGTLFKKLIAGALALLMVGTALPQGSDLTGIFGGSEITASAETVGGTCGVNANWSFDTETGKLTITGTGEMASAPWRDSYKDDITSVEIKKGITTIDTDAFKGCISLASVTIPGTVETIAHDAFSECVALEKVTIQNGVKEIVENAFFSCSKLKQVTIPGSIDNIDVYAFNNCKNIEQVTILEGSRTIQTRVLAAFRDCGKLTSVVVPSSVTEIEAIAFRKIENLKTIYMQCDPAYLAWDFSYGNYIRYSSEEGKKVDVYVPYMYKQGYLNKFKSAFFSLSDADFLSAYNVSVNGLVTNGSVVADRFMAAQGETVHFTVTPNPTCIVKHVAVNGNEVANNSDGTYSFVMPAEDVSILAIIERFNAAHLYGHSISLDGDIGVNFYMELDQSILSSQTAYMQFDVPDGKKTETQIVYVKDVLDDPVTISGRTYFKFKCRVAAKDMAAEIVAQLHDGNTRGEEYKYSVREYAEYILDNSDDYNDKTIKLVKAMLNYGSAAQEYFLNESGSDLANYDLDTGYDLVDEVTAEIINKPYYAIVTKLPEDVTFEGVTLSLRSKTTLSFYFKSDTDLSSVLGDSFPIETTPDGYQVYRIRGISASELDNDFSFRFGSYCPLTYCYNVLHRKSGSDALQKVCKALFLYNQAANDYFD